MDLVGDDRAQSVQIGAVLLFGILIISFSSYQAFVVPDQNRAVEFDHSQRVQSQMQDLRNAVVSATGETSARAVSVALGTQYPSRAVAVNPGPPTGSLRTVGTTNDSVTFDIDNATAAGEADDYWDGGLKEYNTGGLVYQPNYNLYTNAPTTVYEQTVVYNAFRGDSLSMSGQVLVDGRDVTVVTLNGSLSRTAAGSTSVDVRPVSTSDRSITVENEGGRITLSFYSRLDESKWQRLLDSEYDPGTSDPEKHVAAIDGTRVGDGLYRIDVVLEPGEYDLRMTKVGVGTRVRSEDVSYLTNVTANGTSVTAGEETRIVVEARDRYNNPVAGETVNATSDATGALASSTATTGDDGRAAFTFDATDLGPGTYRVRTSLRTIDNATYEASGKENVTLLVEVRAAPGGGGGGSDAAYSLDWQDPDDSNPSGPLSSCTDADCTWDVGQDSDGELDLLSKTSEDLGGLTVEFAVNNTTVGTVSPDENGTDSQGEAGTDLTAAENGTVGVYAASGGASDVINITVENVTGGGATAASNVDLVGSTTAGGGNSDVEFDLENTGSSSATISAISIDSTTSSSATVVENSGGNPEFFQDGNARLDQSLQIDGTTYQLDTDATIDGGATEPFTLERFRDSNGDKVDMSGEDVTITLYYSDGSSGQYTLTL